MKNLSNFYYKTKNLNIFLTIMSKIKIWLNINAFQDIYINKPFYDFLCSQISDI